MAQTTWTLTDQASDTYQECLEVTADQVGGAAQGYRIEKRRLRGGPSDGVDVVRIDNGSLQFDVLPTRGMGLWKAWCGGVAVGWNSPVRGPVHPSLVPMADPGGLGWLDGFDELLVRCGLESNGAPEFNDQGGLVYGLHGRIGNKPAHFVELSVDGETGDITLRGIVDEIRFHFFKLRLTTTIKTRAGQKSIEIQDTVQNLSDSPTGIQLLYHINVGPPLLGSGASLVAPVKTLVPRNDWAAASLSRWSVYDPPAAGTEEQVYFFNLLANNDNRSGVLLKNAAGDRGFGVQFDTSQLPCFTLWKNQTAEADGYVTGIEPATNYPNPRSFEESQGRVVNLQPGQSRQFDLCLNFHSEASEVAAAEQQIAALSTGEPVIHQTPQPGWCADA